MSAVFSRARDALAGAPISGDSGGAARPTDPIKRIFVKSFGCQMNVYDSHRMADVARLEGYQEVAKIEDADLIVLNTCHIRERASEKVFSELGKIREMKEELIFVRRLHPSDG